MEILWLSDWIQHQLLVATSAAHWFHVTELDWHGLCSTCACPSFGQCIDSGGVAGAAAAGGAAGAAAGAAGPVISQAPPDLGPQPPVLNPEWPWHWPGLPEPPKYLPEGTNPEAPEPGSESEPRCGDSELSQPEKFDCVTDLLDANRAYYTGKIENPMLEGEGGEAAP